MSNDAPSHNHHNHEVVIYATQRSHFIKLSTGDVQSFVYCQMGTYSTIPFRDGGYKDTKTMKEANQWIVLGGAAWGGLVHKYLYNLPFFGTFIVFLDFID